MIHHLSVTNFRAIRGTKEYPLAPGVTALIGRNERGKTSSFLALAFALYGAQAMPEGVSAEDLVNDHAKECSVTVRFDHKGDEYELTRTQRRKGTGDATLTRNGEPFASGRAPVTQAVTQLFGVDHVGFLVSVFARQDELDALAGKRGAERVTTMLRLLGVDQAEAALKGIRKDANEERRSLELLRAGVVDVDHLHAQREDVTRALDAQRAGLVEARDEEASREANISVLGDDLAALAPKRTAHEQWHARRREAELALAAAQSRYGATREAATGDLGVPPVEPTYESVDAPSQEDVAASESAYTEARERWSAIDSELRSLRNERDTLTDSCAACGRPFDNAEQVAAHRDDLTAKIVALTVDLEDARLAGEEARRLRDDLHAQANRAGLVERENGRRRNTYEHALRDHERRAQEHAAAAVALATAEHHLAEAQGLFDAIAASEPEDPTEAENRIKDALDDERVALTAAQLNIASLASAISAGESHLARVDADLARAQEKAAAITTAQHRVVTLDVAAKEMAAMKERLIGRIIPALEERASAIVSDLTDGKHSELRLTSDYEIQYVTETGGLRSFANLSGGAQRVFALALRLALAELRAGSISFLCLDEVFAAIDDERQGLAWEAVERLQKRYDQVLLITHVEALRERASNLFVVG